MCMEGELKSCTMLKKTHCRVVTIALSRPALKVWADGGKSTEVDSEASTVLID